MLRPLVPHLSEHSSGRRTCVTPHLERRLDGEPALDAVPLTKMRLTSMSSLLIQWQLLVSATRPLSAGCSVCNLKGRDGLTLRSPFSFLLFRLSS